MVTDKTTEASGAKLDLAQVPLSVSNIPLHSFKKRVVICCDGTWQDGVATKELWKHTNILKLSRAFNHVDERSGTPIPQMVYHQTGVRAARNLYSRYVDGATGASLFDKVQEAYAFICQNYHPGDEIFLFGFSKGAYTARMVAMFIGVIGVLDRSDIDYFSDIFVAYQQLGKESDPRKIEQLVASLSKWTSRDSRGKKRADSDDDSFSIKCVGLFDSIGSVGLPEELTNKSPSTKSIFGFPNNQLGEHIERTYHALAINENRLDFDCCKFEQTYGGRRKGQILEQCWFSGSHSDIGGGWEQHDLSDVTLAWMVANIGDMLSIDVAYIASLPNPVAPWGEQFPHDPRTGIFSLTEAHVRKLPTVTDNITHETIHPSVLRQKIPISFNPALLCELLPLERTAEELAIHRKGCAALLSTHSSLSWSRVCHLAQFENTHRMPGGFYDDPSDGLHTSATHNTHSSTDESTELQQSTRQNVTPDDGPVHVRQTPNAGDEQSEDTHRMLEGFNVDVPDDVDISAMRSTHPSADGSTELQQSTMRNVTPDGGPVHASATRSTHPGTEESTELVQSRRRNASSDGGPRPVKFAAAQDTRTLYVARRPERVSDKARHIKNPTWWIRCIMFICCVSHKTDTHQ